MPFAAVGLAASVAAPLISGALQSGASSDGAAAATGASQATIDTATKNAAPYTTAGATATTAYGDLLGLNGADAATKAMSGFTASPGFGYQVEQGLRAVDSGAAARGMLRSGATLKAEQTLGNNLANQDFGNYLGRINALATTGAGVTNSLNGLISGQGTNQAAIANNAGAQQASIYGNTAQGVVNGIGLANKNGLFDNIGIGTSNSLFGGAGTSGGFVGGFV